MTELASAPERAPAGDLEADHPLDRRPGRGRGRPAARAVSSTPRPARRRPRSTSRRSRRSTAAVAAAKAAFPAWRAVSLSKRAELMFRIRELVNQHREDLARLLTAEHGKVFSDAMGEVARGSRGDRVRLRHPDARSRAASRSRRRPGSTSTRSGSRSASSPASRRSTSRRWCPCGCGRRRSPAATRSC